MQFSHPCHFSYFCQMDLDQEKFELDFQDGRISVRRHSIGAQVLFRVVFSDRRTPLVVTRATHANAYRFWTSIPEGRQNEAEEVGVLISEYFKTFQ
jgi:hypothetical protein